MSTTYFDLHFHPLFKKYITKYESHFPTQRHFMEIGQRITLTNKLANVLDEVVLHILQSQSAMNDCLNHGVRLGVAALANVEFGFADSKGPMASVLKSQFTAPLDKTYFQLVRTGSISYYRMMLKELDLYRALAKVNGPIGMISRKLHKDLADMPANQKIKLLISLEGAHNLYRAKIGQTLQYDEVSEEDGYDSNDIMVKDNNKGADIGINPVESLQAFMQMLWDTNMDMMYITLTHLTHVAEQFICTHAFGMKMLKHASFYPSGNGLTNLGRELVDACHMLQIKDDAGEWRPAEVLIDLKHLGLKSRMDLYEHRKATNNKSPLIASHVGVTGYSINEWKYALKQKKCKVYTYEGVRSVEIETARKRCGEWGSGINNEFTFNPWSINLMDEDLVQIFESNGLIGVSLDVRILGFQAKIGMSAGDTSEYISTADFQTHFPHISLLGLPAQTLESMATQAESWLVPTKEERHPLCLCFNIIHIVSVGYLRGPQGIDPWDHITIGSDYDGMIEPLKICPDVSAIEDLEYNLLKWLPVAAKAYHKENGGIQVLPDNATEHTTLKTLVRKIMYGNGERFINNWLKGAPGASSKPELYE